MRTLIFVSFAALALAGCGAEPAQNNNTESFEDVSAEVNPESLVDVDYTVSKRCKDPKSAADLVVRVPGTQSDVGKAYRRAGCVTLAVYEAVYKSDKGSEKGSLSYEFGHWQPAIAEYPAQEVIKSYSGNEVVIYRPDFRPTNLTAAEIAAVAKEVG